MGSKAHNLEKSVIDTLAYYKAIKTPLSLVQIGRYLINVKTQSLNVRTTTQISKPIYEIKQALDLLVKKGSVIEQKGLYWLRSRNIQHETHNVSNPAVTCSMLRVPWQYVQREKIAQRKIEKVQKAIKFFRFIPGLRGVYICGSVARKVCRRSSDIDFLILTEKGRVWTVRFFLTVLSFLLGKKTRDNVTSYLPTGQAGRLHVTRRDKFCLNHYRSTDKLKLEKNLQDLYSAQEYAGMINVHETWNMKHGTWETEPSPCGNFYKANAKWMKKILPNFDFTKPPLILHSSFSIFHFPLSMGDWLEKILQKLQTAKILRSSRNFNQLDNRRIVTDNNVIMFHLNPRAPEIIRRHKKILDSFNI